MTTDSSAQVMRITHALGADTADLAFLEDVDSATLRLLHAQIVDVLFDTSDTRLGALLGAAKILPPAITAKIAEKALGPILCGRIAGSVEPSLAVSIAKRLPNTFLADVAGHVHPHQIEAIIKRLPTGQVNAAAAVLVERGDVVALGHFSSIVTDATLRTVIGSLSSAALLDVAPFVEPVEKMSHLLSLIDDAGVLDVIRSADRDDRWVDAFDLVNRLDVSLRTRIAGLVVPETELIDRAIRAAVEHDQFSGLLAFAMHASDVPEDSWNEVTCLRDKKMITAAVDAAERHDLWEQMSVLVSLWPEDLRKAVSKLVKAKYRGRLGL